LSRLGIAGSDPEHDNEEDHMAGITKKSFDMPDETRTPEKTRIEVVNLGTAKAFRMTAQPGWRWSECVKPVAKTDSCQARHVGTVASGRLRIAHNDGTEVEVAPGDAYVIEAGHDAWVVGDEAFVGYEFESGTADTFARGS
jgi:uncharacterized protein YjlB